MTAMSSEDRLVYMANQIARNFAIGGAESAALATADHIANYWEARMRAQIFARADHADHGLQPIAARAIEILRTRGAPPPQTGATVFGDAGTAGGSDAG